MKHKYHRQKNVKPKPVLNVPVRGAMDTLSRQFIVPRGPGNKKRK